LQKGIEGFVLMVNETLLVLKKEARLNPNVPPSPVTPAAGWFPGERFSKFPRALYSPILFIFKTDSRLARARFSGHLVAPRTEMEH
jgi:hypothetical protein